MWSLASTKVGLAKLKRGVAIHEQTRRTDHSGWVRESASLYAMMDSDGDVVGVDLMESRGFGVGVDKDFFNDFDDDLFDESEMTKP